LIEKEDAGERFASFLIQINIILIFLNYFYMLISKIIFKK